MNLFTPFHGDYYVTQKLTTIIYYDTIITIKIN